MFVIFICIADGTLQLQDSVGTAGRDKKRVRSGSADRQVAVQKGPPGRQEPILYYTILYCTILY